MSRQLKAHSSQLKAQSEEMMVKLTGPVLSSEASGTLGKILTFGKTKGRAILRKKPVPKQPRSGLQVSMRAMMTFLSQQWKNLTDNHQATWAKAAPATDRSGYNTYIKCNLERWRSRRPPSKAFPAAEVNIPGGNPQVVATGGVRHVELTVKIAYSQYDNWTFLLFHSDTASPDPDVDKLVHVFKIEDMDPHYWTHSPLKAGTHHYRVISTSDDGNVYWADTDTDSAVVT